METATSNTEKGLLDTAIFRTISGSSLASYIRVFTRYFPADIQQPSDDKDSDLDNCLTELTQPDDESTSGFKTLDQLDDSISDLPETTHVRRETFSEKIQHRLSQGTEDNPNSYFEDDAILWHSGLDVETGSFREYCEKSLKGPKPRDDNIAEVEHETDPQTQVDLSLCIECRVREHGYNSRILNNVQSVNDWTETLAVCVDCQVFNNNGQDNTVDYSRISCSFYSLCSAPDCTLTCTTNELKNHDISVDDNINTSAHAVIEEFRDARNEPCNVVTLDTELRSDSVNSPRIMTTDLDDTVQSRASSRSLQETTAARCDAHISTNVQPPDISTDNLAAATICVEDIGDHITSSKSAEDDSFDESEDICEDITGFIDDDNKEPDQTMKVASWRRNGSLDLIGTSGSCDDAERTQDCARVRFTTNLSESRISRRSVKDRIRGMFHKEHPLEFLFQQRKKIQQIKRRQKKPSLFSLLNCTSGRL